MKTKSIILFALFALMGWGFTGCSNDEEEIYDGDAKTQAQQILKGMWELYATGTNGENPVSNKDYYLVFKEGGEGLQTDNYAGEEYRTTNFSYQLVEEWHIDDERKMLVGELYHSIYGLFYCRINKKNLILSHNDPNVHYITAPVSYYRKIK